MFVSPYTFLKVIFGSFVLWRLWCWILLLAQPTYWAKRYIDTVKDADQVRVNNAANRGKDDKSIMHTAGEFFAPGNTVGMSGRDSSTHIQPGPFLGLKRYIVNLILIFSPLVSHRGLKRRLEAVALLFALWIPLTSFVMNAFCFLCLPSYLWCIYIAYLVYSLYPHAVSGSIDTSKRQAVTAAVQSSPSPLSLTMLRRLIDGIVDLIKDTSNTGGRPRPWVKNWTVWKWVAAFFPVSLVIDKPETTKFHREQSYLVGYHPHGVFSIGCFTAVATNALGISTLFPSLDLRCGTITLLSRLPFFRELLASLGFMCVQRDAIEHVLTNPIVKLAPENFSKKDKGGEQLASETKDTLITQRRSVLLVVGGANEADLSERHTHQLIIKKRKGFFRIALRTGSFLVPVYAFGETSTFLKLPSFRPFSTLARYLTPLSKASQKSLGFTIPRFTGRGMLDYGLGFLAFRHPVTLVMGEPIEVEQVAQPSDQQIHDLQELYCAKLFELFEKHKWKYCVNPEKEKLEIVT